MCTRFTGSALIPWNKRMQRTRSGRANPRSRMRASEVEKADVVALELEAGPVVAAERLRIP